MTAKPQLMLLGLGQINTRVSEGLADEFDIMAVSRMPKNISSAQHIPLNLLNDDLSALKETDYIVFCLTPSSYDEAGYRQTYVDCLSRVLNHYRQHPPKHFLFISSSSVYGQNQDEWVDESSATVPRSFSGRIIVEAEKMLSASTIPTTTIRFSGIYGRNRTSLIEQIKRGNKSSQPPSNYTNRISETDAVGIICHLLRQAEEGVPLADCYLASDHEPVRLHEVVGWVRQQIPCQPEKGNSQTASGKSQVGRKGGFSRTGSKRCRNQRIRSTGYQFRFPSYREGYADVIAANPELQLKTLP